MRELAWAAIVAVATGMGAFGTEHGSTSTGRRPMTISGMTYLGSYSAGDKVKVWRGQPADIVVRGQLLDLSTGVEVKTSGGSAATGVTASITARQGGSNTQITIRVSASTSAALASY